MITVIGASCIDIICQNVSKGVFETGHEFADSISLTFGGDGLNQAIILSKINQNVEFITVIGKDEAGNSIYKYCKDNNVDIVPSIKSHTYMSTILVDSNGNRNLIGTKDGSLRELSLDDIKDINGDIVSFASMFISNILSRDDMKELFSNIKKQNKILCVDTTTIKHNETIDEYINVLNKIDYFFPNEKEAMLFTRKDTIEEAADILFEAGIKNVIIKCGDKGSYIKNKQYAKYIPVDAVKAIDTTGCGDSFVSGFINALSKGEDIIECIKQGNVCGRRCALSIGATSWL